MYRFVFFLSSSLVSVVTAEHFDAANSAEDRGTDRVQDSFFVFLFLYFYLLSYSEFSLCLFLNILWTISYFVSSY